MPPAKRTSGSSGARRAKTSGAKASGAKASGAKASGAKTSRAKTSARRRAPATETPPKKQPRRPDVPPTGRAPFEDAPPRREAPPVSPFQPGFAPECLACPFGLVFFAMKNTKPEVMDHLMRAGLELFQAVKAVMDTYADRWDQAQQLQRIPIA